ncbi:MAG: acyltransferase family protein [Ignavibacteriales bacterium]|nr:acyltransferase family protein [Ignavibacteriales bacterium]
MESINRNQRFYYLDWIRIIATGSVFILHVAHIFDEIPFQIQNNETNTFFLIIVANLNFWIMPLFFLIAGVSAFLSLKKRTNKTYLKERVIRLLIPFCTGLFVLALPQDYVEALNYGRFSGSFIEFIPFHLNNAIELIQNTNILFSTALFAEFAHHVWFLAFLFLYSLISLPLFRFLQGRANTFLQLWTSKINHPISLFIPVIPLFLIQSILRPLDATYSGWPAFIYWGSFFIMGFSIFSNHKTMDVIERYWYIFPIIGVISFMSILLYLARFGTLLYDNPDYSFICLIGHFLWSLTSFSWVFIFISIGRKWLNIKSSHLFHIASISMPFYMIHLPVILIVAYFTVMMQLNMYLKFGIIFVVSFITTVLLIEGVIRKVKPLAFIFGMK